VDDDADIALTFKNGLESIGFQVEAFVSAQELLSYFKPDYYSLLLIDIRMEEMSGFELYKRIREKDNKPRVCFITSFPNYYESLIENYPEFELTCLIAKPITIENLIARIKAELGTNSDNS
jgi:DNA-binding response OmpR family regulator